MAALTAGSHLGPYEILSVAGAGGMGEVYRARDTRLSRIVAIKVLPQHLSGQAELRERFERDFLAERFVARVNFEDLFAALIVGASDDDLTIEPPRP